jgi:MFS family permease
MKLITRTIWVLSLISLFTDMASEMLYPVMPIFLSSIGFSVIYIGILEGIAEAVAGLSKGYFGKMSDNMGKRLPFVQAGYGLSALSKPMMALFIHPLWILLARTTDRLGKGIRTGARDAMLSDETSNETKGQIFGFHRSMDTLGAVLGPLCALAYLYYRPNDYKALFYIAFIPGVIAVLCSYLIKEKRTEKKEKKVTHFFDFFKYWKNAPAPYKQLVKGLLLFAFLNSSDIFLLLKVKEAGISDVGTLSLYIGYNLVYALFAYSIGKIADRIGLKKVFIAGLVLFSMTYLGFAFNKSIAGFIALFFVYGVYAAATEGIAKAWISNIADRKYSATAIGTFTGFQSIATLIASSVTGLLWFAAGPEITFGIIGAGSLGLVLYFKKI